MNNTKEVSLKAVSGFCGATKVQISEHGAEIIYDGEGRGEDYGYRDISLDEGECRRLRDLLNEYFPSKTPVSGGKVEWLAKHFEGMSKTFPNEPLYSETLQLIRRTQE